MIKVEVATGTIFDIKRFAVHDGPGIRTTVFLKGCPLRCEWCHNPESINRRPELVLFQERCIGCGACLTACPNGAHGTSEGGERTYDRDACELCGACVETCYAEALVMYGRQVTVEDVMVEVRKDTVFYENSGGGLTLSGGEPLFQLEFTTALLRQSKEESFHTALDTCGQVSWSAFEDALPFVDLVLYDLKHLDSEQHRRHTGVTNTRILDNLRRISDQHIPIEIRMPIIPTINDSQPVIQATGDFLASLDSIVGVRLLPYHRLGIAKYLRLGRENTMPNVEPPDRERMQEIAGWLRRDGLKIITPD